MENFPDLGVTSKAGGGGGETGWWRTYKVFQLPSISSYNRQEKGDTSIEKRFCNTCSRVPENIPVSFGPFVMHSINPCD